MLILRHADVAEILSGAEASTVDVVRAAYRLHDEGRTTVPQSTFLRFPHSDRDRIIGLPAYVGGPDPAAGFKWVASFPGNLDAGMPRASAVVVLNSLRTGQPEALLEGSLISATRTAASAALAAGMLCDPAPAGVTLVGCGVINLAVLRFLRVTVPGLRAAVVYDTDPARAAAFAARCAALAPELAVTTAPGLGRALAAHPLVSIATTATVPHLNLSPCPPGTVVLHVSLRDIYPETILASQNVVDDADHVCRERTSVHLAEQQSGGRRFIDASIGQLIRGTVELRRAPDRPLVFSPFGLGALDIALARSVVQTARRRGTGIDIDGFLPAGPEPAGPESTGPEPAGAPGDRELAAATDGRVN